MQASLKTKSLLITISILFLIAPINSTATENPGLNYYKSWNNIIQSSSSIFLSYNANDLEPDEINTFNVWHKTSSFKDISPKINNSYFFKSPWPHEIFIDKNGDIVFNRTQTQIEPHTMIELSINNKNLGNFIDYGGYRSMSLGTPYEIELEVMAVKGDWILTIPWVLIFQAHAIPDIFDRGKKFNPPFALVISRGRWEAHIRADSRLSLPKDKSYERFDKIDLGKVEPDIWTRFIIRVMWGYKDFPEETNTALGIWRDGKLYHKEWGIKNFYNNTTLTGKKLGPYLMIGNYTPVFPEKYNTISIKFKSIKLKSYQ